MNASDKKRLVELLGSVLELQPEARQTFLDEACRDEPTLRGEVERILANEEDARESLRRMTDDTHQPSLLRHPEKVGPYRIVDLLGEGGMGVVYLAEDPRLRRNVALKLLPASLTSDPSRHARLLAEARAASALNHPNVCTVFDVGQTPDGCSFIAMEYVKGRTLDTFVSGDEKLDIRRIVEIGSQVADALAEAHDNGIVHRDIKSANISLNERGQVKVLDFGIAKRLTVDESLKATRTESGSEWMQSSAERTLPGEVLGTPLYMSPEQALGRSVDHRTDIFSLGIVLYELVTGRAPFRGSNMTELLDKIIHSTPEAMTCFNRDVPSSLQRIVLTCLQKEPERRYQSARELRVDLEELGEELRGSESNRWSSSLRDEESAVLSGSHPCEIFMNCTAADDRPLAPGRLGWVSRLRQSLESRIEQLSGEAVRVGGYPVPTGESQLDERIVAVVPRARAMVSVVSPSFVKTEACRRELELFWKEAEGRCPAGELPPIFKAVKMPVPDAEISPGLAALLSRLMDVEFFEEDPQTGRLCEFDEPFGDEAEKRFFERVYDLAFQICRSLSSDPSRAEESEAGANVVYLAETTSDLREEREQIRRELQERGYHVLPDSPLPVLAAEELETTIVTYLDQARLSVHFIGERYGLVPEDATESFAELQLRLATDASRGLARILWSPKGLDPKDTRQEAFLRRVRRTAEFLNGADFVEGTLHELKKVMLSKLTREPATSPGRASPDAPPLVYLVCDRVDEEAVEPLEDFLFERGLEIRTPDFEADETEFAEAHHANLKECDAVVFFYGGVRKSWVEAHLRDLSKAFGYGRSRPFGEKLVYIAPPLGRRKERFKTQLAERFIQPNGFQATAQLEGFVSRIRERTSIDRGD